VNRKFEEMKNVPVICALFIILILGCNSTPNEELRDDQIPPESQLILVDAARLSSDYASGKSFPKGVEKRNPANDKYLGKWLKVTGTVANFYNRTDGFKIALRGSPEIFCYGKMPKNRGLELKTNQTVTVVGRLTSGGNFSSLDLNPCKAL
jgi:hypothetical protein